MARAAPYLEAYDIGVAPTGKKLDARGLELREDDRKAKDNFREVLDLARQGGLEHGFDEGDFFAGPDAVVCVAPRSRKGQGTDVVSDLEGAIQDAFPQCLPNHGLRRLRQVSTMGQAPGFRLRNGPQNPFRTGRESTRVRPDNLTCRSLAAHLADRLSPKVNPDLLQRSEVVALFNTLHRISESLAAVEHFRQMYAETQAIEAENAHAQNTTSVCLSRRRIPHLLLLVRS